MTTATLVVACGLLGLAVGSFLNVCIHRLPRRESINFPASHCPRCRTPIRWVHNVPVVGYLVLGGRCASCRAPISVQYPLVEAATGILFAAHGWVFGLEPILAVRLVFCAAMIVLFVIDLHHHILPNVITVPGLVAGLAASAVLPPGWRDALIGATLGGGLLWGIAEAYYRIRGEDGLGFGDVKMLAMIGAFLGWKLVLLTLVLSSLAGAIVGVGLLLSGRGSMKYALPYGTFLAVAALVASLSGLPLVEWYMGFYQ